jgi:arylsulfatase A-like enzyme
MTMSRPNLVYVFADQLRHDVFGHVGDAKAITPNIDKLAAQGMRFENATCVTPVCAAYRASLLTGKYTSSTGMVINESCMNPNHDTIAYRLHEEGYNLGYLGKWHLVDQHGRSIPQGPARLGFQHASEWKAYNFNHNNHQGYYWQDEGADMVKVPIEGYQTDAWNRMACEFIETAATRDEPFALFLSYSPPHDPWTQDNLPPGYYEKFEGVDFGHPPNFKEEPDQYADRAKSVEEFDGWKQSLPENRRCYYAMVSHLDDKLGELTEALERAGCAENTVLVYTSDHGEMFGSQGRVYKLSFYEESCRVPFLVRYPDAVTPGTVSDACLNTPDVAPTLLSLMGIGPIREAEGMDLSHCVRNEPGPEPACAFLQGMGHTYLWQDGAEWRAVRSKRFTYARYLCDGSEHLYDNLSDPGQTRNLADDPEHAETLQSLRAALQSKMSELQDEFMPHTHYQSWMAHDDRYSILRGARGAFSGPHAPVPSLRGAAERGRS